MLAWLQQLPHSKWWPCPKSFTTLTVKRRQLIWMFKRTSLCINFLYPLHLLYLKSELRYFTVSNLESLFFSCIFSCSNQVLIDPTSEEETFSTGTITVVVEAVSGKLCGVHQPGTDPLPAAHLENCILEAEKKTKSVLELVRTAVGDVKRWLVSLDCLFN